MPDNSFPLSWSLGHLEDIRHTVTFDCGEPVTFDFTSTDGSLAAGLDLEFWMSLEGAAPFMHLADARFSQPHTGTTFSLTLLTTETRLVAAKYKCEVRDATTKKVLRIFWSQILPSAAFTDPTDPPALVGVGDMLKSVYDADGDGIVDAAALATVATTALAAPWSGITGTRLATASGLTMSTARLLGRSTAGTGAVEEVAVSGATLSGGTLTISGLAIGGTVTGGTAGLIPYIAAGPVLAQKSTLAFDGSTDTLTTSTLSAIAVKASAGSQSNPTLGCWGGSANYGFYFNGSNQVLLSLGGTSHVTFTTGGMQLLSGDVIAWSSSTTDVAAAGDLALSRDAANTLAQRNGANAQTLRVYGTYTDASNYRRISISDGAITAETAGTGGAASMAITSNLHMTLVAGSSGTLLMGSGGTTRWAIDNNFYVGVGHLVPAVDNTYDIGAFGANRPRNVHVAGKISVGPVDSSTYALNVNGNGAQGVRVVTAGGLIANPSFDFLDTTNNVEFVISPNGTNLALGTYSSHPLQLIVGTSVKLTLATTGAATFAGPVIVAPYTFATVPAASSYTGAVIRITDRSGKYAYSDGTNWRFFADDAAIS